MTYADTIDEVPLRVREYLAAKEPGLGLIVLAGTQARAMRKQGAHGANRIAMVPAGGPIVGAQSGGYRGDGRELTTIGFSFDCYVEGYDPRPATAVPAIDTDPMNDLRHLQRAIENMGALVRAMRAAWWVAEFDAVELMNIEDEQLNYRRGIELRTRVTVPIAIYGLDVVTAKPDYVDTTKEV